MRLRPGSLTSKQFELFIDISTIRSESAVRALKDYFVGGQKRGTVCLMHGVSPGYLSLKIKQCQLLNDKLYAFISVASSEPSGRG